MPAYKTQGVQLQRATEASPEVFVTIGQVTGFDGPGGEAAEIKTTNLQSTAHEYLIGLKNEGDFSFDINLDPGDPAQVGLRQDRDNNTPRNFKLILTDATPTNLTFTAFVKGFRITGQTDDAIRAKIALRITGAVVWTP